MHRLLECGGFVNGAVSRHVLVIRDSSDAVTACVLLLLTHTHHTHHTTHTLHTHTPKQKYVILIAFSRQQWLCELACML